MTIGGIAARSERNSQGLWISVIVRLEGTSFGRQACKAGRYSRILHGGPPAGLVIVEP